MNARFLHVTPIAPLPYGNGLAMRTSLFAEALGRIGAVDILVVGDEPPMQPRHGFGGHQVSLLSTHQRHDTKLGLISAIPDAFSRAAALRENGRPFATRAISAPVVSDFMRLLAAGSWQGIVISRAHMLPLFTGLPQWPQVPIVVDLDDDDAGLARQGAEIARRDGDEGRAQWLEAEADSFDILIGKAASQVRLLTTASCDTAAAISVRISCNSLEVVPNGIDIPAVDRALAVGDKLIFVGNLSYGPNVDGLTWFVRDVWPPLRATRPEARLVVAGSRPDRSLRRLCQAPGITVLGDPPSLTSLYREAGAAIVPLRTGSGSRIKILEAGAHGVPVVSTHEGAAGLALDPDRHFFAAAADPTAFRNACLECLGNRGAARTRAQGLHEFVRERHDRNVIIASLERVLGYAFGA